MVRIINDKPDKSVLNLKICHNCDVTIEYISADVKKRRGPDGCKWIDCPKCQKRIILESW